MAAIREKIRHGFTKLAVYDATANGERHIVMQEQIKEEEKRRQKANKQRQAELRASDPTKASKEAPESDSTDTDVEQRIALLGANAVPAAPSAGLMSAIRGVSDIEITTGGEDDSIIPVRQATSHVAKVGSVVSSSNIKNTSTTAIAPQASSPEKKTTAARPAADSRGDDQMAKWISEFTKLPRRIMMLLEAEKEARQAVADRDREEQTRERERRKKMQSNDVALDWFDYVAQSNKSPTVLLRRPVYEVATGGTSTDAVQREFDRQKQDFQDTRAALRKALFASSDPSERRFAVKVLESVIPVDLGPAELQQVIYAQRRSLAAFERRTWNLKRDLGRQTFELNRLKKRFSKISNPFEEDGGDEGGFNNSEDKPVAVMNTDTGLRQELDVSRDEDSDDEDEDKVETIYEQFKQNFYAGEWGDALRNVKEVSRQKLVVPKQDWKTKKVKELSRALKVDRFTMLVMWDMFEEVDEDGSGLIELGEFHQMLKKIYRDNSLDLKVAENLFRNFAPQGSMNVIDFFNFAKYNGLMATDKKAKMDNKAKDAAAKKK
ncbi:unnamed protein product [Amoebophrya sp. A25]|nr:unnamed protein product [Amoebophrya sp. A25]|eukprot:GSA25T00021853001.1